LQECKRYVPNATAHEHDCKRGINFVRMAGPPRA